MSDAADGPLDPDASQPGSERRVADRRRLGRGMVVILLIGGVIAGFTVVLGVMSFAILGRDDLPDPKVDFRDQNEFRDGCALIPGDEVTDLLGSPPTAPKEFPALGGGCIWKGTDGTVLEIQLHPRDPEALPDGEQRKVDGATVVDLGVRPVSVAGDPNAVGHSMWVRTDDVTARVELSREDDAAKPLIDDLADALARRLPLAETGPPPALTPTTLG
ncbi:MAG: hypothetical protein WAX12_16980 [Candidatus Microthrix subdominans]